MVTALKTAPAIYPVTALELKRHLYLDTLSFADQIGVVQSIAPGTHVIAAAYSLVGTAVDVLAYDSLVSLDCGTNLTGGAVDVKIQHSDDNITFADWTGGAFTQVTTANDNAAYEKQYTGGKRYIRAVATVAAASCDFSVTVVRGAPNSQEDETIDDLIAGATEAIETAWLGGVSLISQTWYAYPECWPGETFIELPRPPLASVTGVTYALYGESTYANTLSADDYTVDIVHRPGRVWLNDGGSWPSGTLRGFNPIQIEMVTGYGAAASSVPISLRRAIKFLAADWYHHPENRISGTITKELDFIEALTNSYRNWTV